MGEVVSWFRLPVWCKARLGRRGRSLGGFSGDGGNAGGVLVGGGGGLACQRDEFEVVGYRWVVD